MWQPLWFVLALEPAQGRTVVLFCNDRAGPSTLALPRLCPLSVSVPVPVK